MLLAAPAVAGTVYRCTGADGSSSYSSDRIDGARCKAVSNFKPAPAAASPTNAPKRVTGQVYSYVEVGVRHYSSKRPRGQVDALRTISYSYRSEERRVGKECVSKCSSRWSQYH